jgi:hypothetical protein
MVTNIHKICARLGGKLTHREIQLHLAYHLLRSPANNLRKRDPSTSIIGARPSKFPTRKGQHAWGKTISWGVKRGSCQGCARARPGRPRKALGERNGNSRIRVPTSRSGCLQCKAALCSSYCWTEFHSRRNGELWLARIARRTLQIRIRAIIIVII